MPCGKKKRKRGKGRKIVALASLALLALCVPAAAEVTAGIGGLGTIIIKNLDESQISTSASSKVDDTEQFQVGDPLINAIIRGPLTPRSELAIVVSWDGDEMAGIGGRYIMDPIPENAWKMGVGIRGFVLGEDKHYIDELSGFFGGEFLVEYKEPLGLDAPITATVAAYTDIFGDDATVLQFGADISFPIQPAD